MPIIFRRNGKTQPPTTQPATKPLEKTVCNEKQELINEVVTATLNTQNRAVLKMLEYIKKLGVVGNISVSEEFAHQPICMRRQSAVNQIKLARKQLKAIDEILTAHKL